MREPRDELDWLVFVPILIAGVIALAVVTPFFVVIGGIIAAATG